MSEMVERVARALAVADGMHPEAVSNDGDEVAVWTLYVADARAAIEAMREPTQAMRHAVWNRLERSAEVGNLRFGHIAGDGHPDALMGAIVAAALE